jgi:hypothetical protein
MSTLYHNVTGEPWSNIDATGSRDVREDPISVSLIPTGGQLGGYLVANEPVLVITARAWPWQRGNDPRGVAGIATRQRAIAVRLCREYGAARAELHSSSYGEGPWIREIVYPDGSYQPQFFDGHHDGPVQPASKG